MGYARWYFLVDSGDEAHPITRQLAEQIIGGTVAAAAVRRDEDGVLLASVGLRLEHRVPCTVTEVALFPLAAKAEGIGRPISPIGPRVVDNLRKAIRYKLNRIKVQRLDRIEVALCAELRAEVVAGRYIGWVYDDLIGAGRQRIYGPDGGVKAVGSERQADRTSQKTE